LSNSLATLALLKEFDDAQWGCFERIILVYVEGNLISCTNVLLIKREKGSYVYYVIVERILCLPIIGLVYVPFLKVDVRALLLYLLSTYVYVHNSVCLVLYDGSKNPLMGTLLKH